MKFCYGVLLILLFASLATVGCYQPKAETETPSATPPADFKPDILGAEDQPSDLYAEAKIMGTVTDSRLAEISGLTPSRTAKGLWWVHNDSGNEAKLYVLNGQGRTLGAFTVVGATNEDWEDMAGYKDNHGKARIYLADSGNNGGTREEFTLYGLPEPDLAKGMSGETAPVEKFLFRYPNGKPDVEAIFVDPTNGRPYLVTKTAKPPCAIYRFPWPLRTDQTMTLEKVTGRGAEAISQLTLVTGAAASPDGTRVVVRTYFTALELVREKGKPFEAVFAAQPQRLKVPLERQGEAISYSSDGKSLITTSEKLPAPLFLLMRK